MYSNIEYMFRAGRIEMPDEAERLQGIGKKLVAGLQQVDAQAALAGDPAILRAMLRVGGDVYDVERSAIVELYDCAAAVLCTARHFVATDENARDEYNKMTPDTRNAADPPAQPPTLPPDLGDPETPGAPGTPSTPDPSSPGDDRAGRDNRDTDPTDRWGH